MSFLHLRSVTPADQMYVCPPDSARGADANLRMSFSPPALWFDLFKPRGGSKLRSINYRDARR